MTNISINAGQLASREDWKIVEDEGGYVVAPEGELVEESDLVKWLPEWLQKPFRGLLNIGKTIQGWIGKAFDFVKSKLNWSFSTAVGWLSAASSFIWNFNWNIGDQAIEEQLKSSLTGLAGQLGGFVGQAAGWVFCGALPGLVVMRFNEALGLKILRDVGEEALDELSSSFGALLNSTFRIAATYVFMRLYSSTRRLYWRFFKKGQKLPDFDKRKPWSFASAFEEWNEKNLPAVQNYYEEMREEFSEACTEAGYVVANTLDSEFAMRKLENEALNPTRIIELDLQRS